MKNKDFLFSEISYAKSIARLINFGKRYFLCSSTSVMKVAMIAIALVLPQGAALADDIGSTTATESASTQSSIPNNLDEWFERSDRVLESQPHWTTPIATTGAGLKQEYKYDQHWQDKPKGVDLQNYGFNQGLELITSERTQLTLGCQLIKKRQAIDKTSKGSLMNPYR